MLSRTLSSLRLWYPWVVQRPNPASPDVLDDFKLFAVVGAWMEEDVIEATVRNAFTQGCERVFLVDNESPGGRSRPRLRPERSSPNPSRPRATTRISESDS
jgi:hypothetical protein